jgi:hypothetical protein
LSDGSPIVKSSLLLLRRLNSWPSLLEAELFFEPESVDAAVVELTLLATLVVVLALLLPSVDGEVVDS